MNSGADLGREKDQVLPIPSLNAVDVGSESLSATLCPTNAFSEYLVETIQAPRTCVGAASEGCSHQSQGKIENSSDQRRRCRHIGRSRDTTIQVHGWHGVVRGTRERAIQRVQQDASSNLCKYCSDAPVLSWTFPYQEMPNEIRAVTNANWAGELEALLSTSCGWIYFGDHLLETYSSTQQFAAL